MNLYKYSQKQIEFLQCLLTIADQYIEFDILTELFQIIGTEKKQFANILTELTQSGFLFRKDTAFKLNPKIIQPLKNTFKPTPETCDTFIYSFMNIFQPPYHQVRDVHEFLFLKFLNNINGKNPNLATVINFYASYLFYKNNLDNALKYNQLSIQIFEKLAPEHDNIVDAYILKPAIYFKAQNYDKALQQAFEIEQKILKLPFRTHKKLINLYKIIAELYYHKQNYSKAIEFAQKAIEINNQESLTHINIYQIILLSAIEKRDFKLAHTANQKALQTFYKLPGNLQDQKLLSALKIQHNSLKDIENNLAKTQRFSKTIKFFKYLLIILAIIASVLFIVLITR